MGGVPEKGLTVARLASPERIRNAPDFSIRMFGFLLIGVLSIPRLARRAALIHAKVNRSVAVSEANPGTSQMQRLASGVMSRISVSTLATAATPMAGIACQSILSSLFGEAFAL